MRGGLGTALITAAVALLAAPGQALATPTIGKLQVIHTDDFAHGHSKSIATVRTKSGRYRRVALTARKRIKFLSRGAARAAEVYSGGSVRLRTAVFLINFSNERGEPWTPAQVRSQIFTGADSTNSYLKEVSGGNVSLRGKNNINGDIFGWYKLNVSRSTCDLFDWANRAKQKARDAGADLSGYDRWMYIFPSTPGCPFLGSSEIGGRGSWYNGRIETRVTTHELGHNAGAWHASRRTCNVAGRRLADAAGCTDDEYGDPFDTMGSNNNHYSAFHKVQMGLMANANVTSAVGLGPTQPIYGDYRIVASEEVRPAGSRQMLLLRRTANGSNSRISQYSLEYRRPFGRYDNFAATDPVVNGVSIRGSDSPFTSPFTDNFTKLIDPSPWSADSVLLPGQSFWNTLRNETITVLSADATAATVRYSSGPPPGQTVIFEAGNVVYVIAAPGKSNAVTVSNSPEDPGNFFRIKDSVPIAASYPCGYVSQTEVSCLRYGRRIVVLTGDGSDSIRGIASPVPVDMNAGPGPDIVMGGSESDRITASDGERDFVFCGGGVDVADVDTIDPTYDARYCETLRVH